MNKRIKTNITLIIGLILFIASLLTTIMFGAFSPLFQERTIWTSIGYLAISLMTSNIIGSFLSLLITRKLTQTLSSFSDAINNVASGDFKVRIDKTFYNFMVPITNNFNKMIKDLDNMATLRDDFVYTFSHEYKTPIASIKGFAEVLLNEDIPVEEQKEYLQIIYDESSRLSDLAQNVLLISKLDSMEQITEETTYRLDEQIRRVVLMLQKSWENKNLTMNLDLENTIFFGNENLIKQIWINLINNAIRFSKKNEAINIKLKQDGNKVVIKIEDNGIGMDADTIAHIFDKFYQGENSQNMGNGLGLTIVKRIITLCHGEISVSSELNKGTVFEVILKK